MKKVIALLLLVLAVMAMLKYLPSGRDKSPAVLGERLIAEQFIRNHLQRSDGRITTDLESRNKEYLSETAGLWMEYLVLQGDQQSFDQQVSVLKRYFLTNDYGVAWLLKDSKKAPANAFIDDLRIMNALFDAGKKFEDRSYIKLAGKIKKALVRYQIKDRLFIDHIDLNSKQQADAVTLSYIIPAGLDHMKGSKGYKATRELLTEAPLNEAGFFPKTYFLETAGYAYEEEVNMIDQLYLGYHRAQWGSDVSTLLDFIRTAYDKEGKLYGRYQLKSGKPAVSYQSAAVYALAVLLAIETGEESFAAQLYENMKAMQQTDETLPYYGGYIGAGSKDTHAFDNLLALIAERRGLDAGIF